MRKDDLAIFADELSAKATTLNSRLYEARDKIRRASLEREANAALDARTTERLRAIDVLSPDDSRELREEAARLAADLQAVERLCAWTEERLFESRYEPGATRHYDPPDTLTDTVFDPSDETFGPILAALQCGEFERAHKLTGQLPGNARPVILIVRHPECETWVRVEHGEVETIEQDLGSSFDITTLGPGADWTEIDSTIAFWRAECDRLQLPSDSLIRSDIEENIDAINERRPTAPDA